jgi:hypothetical protein
VLVLYVILIVSTLAVIGAGLAFHFRIKRHMSSPGEASHTEPLTRDPSPGNEQSS